MKIPLNPIKPQFSYGFNFWWDLESVFGPIMLKFEGKGLHDLDTAAEVELRMDAGPVPRRMGLGG